MPLGCAAYGCTNSQKKNPELSFYRFPAEKLKREKWISAVKRADSSNCHKRWQPSEYSRICSVHFVSGKKSDHPLSPDYVPSLFCYTPKCIQEKQQGNVELFEKRQKAKQRRRDTVAKQEAAGTLLELASGKTFSNEAMDAGVEGKDEQVDEDETDIQNSSSVQHCETQTDMKETDIQSVLAECQSLRNENIELKSKLDVAVLNIDSLEQNDSKVKMLTGLTSYSVLQVLFNQVKASLSSSSKLSSFQQFFITLLRLGFNLSTQFLSYMFDVHQSTISRIFGNTVEILNDSLVPMLVFWPEREELRKTISADVLVFLTALKYS